MDENCSLVALEQVMEEFFSHSTSNIRKHEIEKQLNDFKQSPHSWKLCLHFLMQSSSHYVIMFSLSILETVINNQWKNADLMYRIQLRNILYEFLLENGIKSPHFIREKYAKLLVDIAREDWPCEYPNFLENILELLKTEHNLLIGLILLRTMSEEFMGTNPNMDKKRRDEIETLLHPFIPVIFQILVRILLNLGEKPRHTATATPPPSPTHPSAFISNTEPQQLVDVANFCVDSKTLNRQVLLTLQHLFTWVPIVEIPQQIVRCIFNFTNISTYAQADDDMCVMAMSTINELLYRRCAPPGTEKFFLQLYQYTLEVLKDLAMSSIYRLESIDSTFMEKFSELTVLLIQQHFWRLETEANISTLEFLSLFFQLTVQLPSVQCYSQCLVVWGAFLKQIKSDNCQKYMEVLFGVMSMLLKKVQFSSNFEQLSQLNARDVNEDNVTEWGAFVKTTNEIVAAVAKFAPSDTFNQVLMQWKVLYDNYRKSVKDVTFVKSLSRNSGERDRLCCLLVDFSTLTSTLTRIAELFMEFDDGELSSKCNSNIACLFEWAVDGCLVAFEANFNSCGIDEKTLSSFNNVHCELLATVETWFFWLIHHKKPDEQPLMTLINVSVPLLMEPISVPVTVSSSAARLWLTLTTRIPLNNLSNFQAVINFVNAPPNSRHVPIETRNLVNGSMCNLLLRNIIDPVKAENEMRQYITAAFFNNLTRDFRMLTSNSDEQHVKDISEHTLTSLSHLLEFCKHFPLGSKKVLYTCLEPTINHALSLFPAYVKYAEVCQNILMFFLNVLDVLQHQMGMDCTKAAVNVFLQVALKEQHLVSAPSHIEKLLRVLRMIVEAPTTAYKNLLPSILELCMQNLHPAISTQVNDHPDMFLSLLKLFYSIIINQWQFFYISQVRSGFSPCVDTETATGSSQKPQELICILQVFGQALLQHDINIFKFAIFALEDLNRKWNLYSKAIFQDFLLNEFLTVLMGTLVEKNHCLLSEDVHVAIYNMANVNFHHFFINYLPEFLRNFQGVSSDDGRVLTESFMHNSDRDMPTFIANLEIFVKNIQMCNCKQRF